MSLFDFDHIEIQITPDEILDVFTEEQLYSQYYPDFKIGNANSPFRQDNNPSFRFYETSYNVSYRIWWNDQKTGESGHVFSFIRKCYKEFFKMDMTIKEVFNQVWTDMKGAQLSHESVSTQVRKTRTVTQKLNKESTIIQAILQENEQGVPEWMPAVGLPYWEQFGITQNILRAYNVGYAKEIRIIKFKNGERESHLWFMSIPSSPVYFYYFPGSKHIKGYRPLEKDKKRKWISNVTNAQDVQGWDQCLESADTDLLVLTKSMKDVMWLRSIGVNSMAIHGERHTYTPAQMEFLKQRYRRIISVYDNDMPGMRGALKLRALYDIPCFFIPRTYGAKDITDLYKVNRPVLFQLIDQLKQYLDANYNQHSRVGTAAA